MTTPDSPQLATSNPAGASPVPTSVGPSRRTVLAGVLAMTATSALAAQVATAPAVRATSRALSSATFDVAVDDVTGGVYRVANPQDTYRTNFVLNPTNRPNFDVNDSRWLGDMVFSVRKAGETSPRPAVTGLSDDIRTVTSDASTVTVTYAGTAANAAGIRDFRLTQVYKLAGTAGSQLSWTFTLTNTSAVQLELLDVGFPLPMNSWWASDQSAIYEQNVGRHSYVAKDGSYIYWQRPNGEAPYLVMTPQAGTSLEYKNKARYGEGPFAENDPAWEGLVEYYVHSANAVVARKAQTAQYLPATSLTLAPGESKTYGFTFAWAGSYQGLRDTLFTAGVPDVISLPGMVVPTASKVTLAVRAAGGITGVNGQSGKNITITSQGTRNGYSLYQLTFSALGANNVTLAYGQGRTSVLQYWATEPIEKVINARTTFLTTKQQAKTTRGYDGAYLQWDMARQRLITWDDYPGGGWKEWMAGGSDDLGLGPAAFLARKNVDDPVAAEIASVDYFLQRFILGYLQGRTENGTRTWQIYRWFDGRDGTPNDQGVWRAYNYTHIANTYFHMYEVATTWPGQRTAFSAQDYLTMCFRTLEAMYTKIPLPTPIGDAAHDLGLMGEGTYPEILAALRYEGLTGEAAALQGYLDRKREALFSQKYPFASEASIDTTGFETNYTLAAMYGNTALATKVQSASLACRGLQPLWYFYGSDNRHMGESWWNLGYETHLGAWQQQQYLATYATPADADYADAVRSTYGAYFAGWANVNSGQIEAAAANYGAASWQFQSEKGSSNYSYIPNLDGWWGWSGECDLGFWGGVRTAAVAIVNDPVAGLYAYGGEVSLASSTYTVVPSDGVRQRLFVVPAGVTLSLSRAKYSRAQVSAGGDRVTLTVSGPRGGTSSPVLTLQGLAAGSYEVSVSGGAVLAQVVSAGRPFSVALRDVAAGAVITVARTGTGPGRDVSSSATVQTSYTAAWNRNAALNDGAVLAAGVDEQVRLWGSYRAAGRPASETLTYTWAQPVPVASSRVAFWNDAAQGSGDGVALPQEWRLEYRDSAGTWRPVQLAAGSTYLVNASGKASAVAFTAVSTTAVRVVLSASRSSSGAYSALGVSEWSVHIA